MSDERLLTGRPLDDDLGFEPDPLGLEGYPREAHAYLEQDVPQAGFLWLAVRTGIARVVVGHGLSAQW